MEETIDKSIESHLIIDTTVCFDKEKEMFIVNCECIPVVLYLN